MTKSGVTGKGIKGTLHGWLYLLPAMIFWARLWFTLD